MALNCYNRGCTKSYAEEDNHADACQYHPGVPVFHDALKGWSCCAKRTADFSEFLDIKGCETGRHSNVKPAKVEKSKTEAEEARQMLNASSLTPNREPLDLTPKVRPTNLPMLPIPLTVPPTIAKSLEAARARMAAQREEEEGDGVKIGTLCKRNACGRAYQGEESDAEECVHHPGNPVFHEGMKFWSCCEKKTHDFDVFLNQRGCTTGTHQWKRARGEEEMAKLASCKVDFFQTASTVTVAIFAKCIDPDRTKVLVSGTNLEVTLFFGENTEFNYAAELFDVVDAEASKARVLSTKMEVSFPKKEPGTWKQLEYKGEE